MPDENALLFQSLHYASWLIVTQLDRELLVHHTLDALADFGKTRRVAMFLVNDDKQSFTLLGSYHHGSIETERRAISSKGTALSDVIRAKEPQHYSTIPDSSVLLPGTQEGNKTCLCIPLLDAHNEVTGILTLEDGDRTILADSRADFLGLLRTLIAIALENARLFHLAMVDGLTDLYVRRFFDVRLQEEIHRVRRYGGQLSLLITDIDHFKSFNDTYGHQCGDAVLSESARILKQTLRKNVDVICRYGGEEFGIILPETDTKGALEIADRVRSACEQHEFSYKGQSHRVTLSGGLATFEPARHATPENFIEEADGALYMSKKAGRNRITLASPRQ